MRKNLETHSVRLTLQFLEEFPDQASKNCKTKEKQIANINKSLNDNILPNKRTTVADNLTSELLEMVFKHKKIE